MAGLRVERRSCKFRQPLKKNNAKRNILPHPLLLLSLLFLHCYYPSRRRGLQIDFQLFKSSSRLTVSLCRRYDKTIARFCSIRALSEQSDIITEIFPPSYSHYHGRLDIIKRDGGGMKITVSNGRKTRGVGLFSLSSLRYFAVHGRKCNSGRICGKQRNSVGTVEMAIRTIVFIWTIRATHNAIIKSTALARFAHPRTAFCV